MSEMSYQPYCGCATQKIWKTHDSTTPTTLDYIGNYRDGIDVMAYQILQSSQGGNSRPIIVGVGAPRDATAIGTASAAAGLGTQKFVSYPPNVLAYDLNRSAASAYKKPRGSFAIQRIYNAAGAIPAVGDSIVLIDVKVSEPL